jgi:acyl-coenzyme A thioesterase PaaI-like protein
VEFFKELKDLKPLSMDAYKQSFVSGEQQDRIKVEYYFNHKNGHFYAKVFFGDNVQGPPNHVHGGAIASVLDEAMGGAAWMSGYPAVTIQLKVSFHESIKLRSEVLIDAWVDKVKGKMVWVNSRLNKIDGILYAEAVGTFFLLSKEQFKEMGNIPDEFFDKSKYNFPNE